MSSPAATQRTPVVSGADDQKHRQPRFPVFAEGSPQKNRLLCLRKLTRLVANSRYRPSAGAGQRQLCGCLLQGDWNVSTRLKRISPNGEQSKTSSSWAFIEIGDGLEQQQPRVEAQDRNVRNSLDS